MSGEFAMSSEELNNAINEQMAANSANSKQVDIGKIVFLSVENATTDPEE